MVIDTLLCCGTPSVQYSKRISSGSSMANCLGEVGALEAAECSMEWAAIPPGSAERVLNLLGYGLVAILLISLK